MKRLVYSPSIKVWVKTDSGVVDLSPYVVNCRIERKIDDVSFAEVEFRNPKITQNGKNRFMFTEHETDGKVLPVFHPMDPITIVVERLAGKPVQVFTGYCDTVPDVQLFPGTATIKASCTLKRLLYTYWDPGLPFVQEFLKNYGWNLDMTTGKAGKPLSTENQNVSKVNKLNDSSIGNLVYAVLNEIGGWDPSNIFIQPLPGNIADIVSKLFDEIAKENKNVNKEIADVLQKIVGNGTFGTASAGGGGGSAPGGEPGTSGAVHNLRQKINIIRASANQYGIPPEFPLAVAIVETSLEDNADTGTYHGWYQWASSESYVGQPTLDMSKAHDLGYASGQFCRAAKAREKYKQYGYPTWARSCQLNPSSVNNAATHGIYGAFNPNPDSNALYSDARFPEFINQAKEYLRQYPN
jgi:hypothetical protein